MKEGPDISRLGALIGDPARANILTALMAGRALTASELANEAGVTAQTASRIADFSALVALPHRSSWALVMFLRVPIDNSILDADPRGHPSVSQRLLPRGHLG